MNQMSESLQNRSANWPPVQREVITLFADFVNAFGLPASIGEIFGYIFSSPDPVDFESVIADLQISRGSASQGLKFLRNINAVHVQHPEGTRRSLYSPETSLRSLFSGILSETIQPRLSHSSDQIDLIDALVSAEPPHPVIRDRIDRLRRWNSRASRMVPFLSRFAGSSDKRRKSKDKGQRPESGVTALDLQP